VKEFKDKVAVITGSASGMGRAVAERLAKEGMKVVLADIEQKALDKAESEMKAAGAKVLAVRTDVSKPEDIEALAKKTLDKFGAVHLLHNNAGVSAGNAVWETTLTDWKWCLGVNLWGPILGVHTFLPIMLKQDTECHIICTASMGGLISTPFVGAPYMVSKFGLVALCETLSHELKLMGAKIGVSVLCPGYVNTNIVNPQRNRPAEMCNDPEWEEKRKALDHVKMISEMGHDGCKTGMEPREVAEKVLSAVKEDKFYIITHPEWMMAAQTRMEEILQEKNPTSMMSTLLFGG
jgi:NAD(P)-dependent dehydrogenase (short-subunit alcohol dehydrogenase family)